MNWCSETKYENIEKKGIYKRKLTLCEHKKKAQISRLENNKTQYTHKLKSVEEGTCQDTKRNRSSEECSGSTHFLDTAEGGTSQDTERN